MTRDVEEAVGTGVTIRFEASKCIHSRDCVLGRPDVFVPNVQGEWIHPDAATVEEVAALAHSCPSGLCRCGGSSNKPYCDGTHRTNGFRASGAR